MPGVIPIYSGKQYAISELTQGTDSLVGNIDNYMSALLQYGKNKVLCENGRGLSIQLEITKVGSTPGKV